MPTETETQRESVGPAEAVADAEDCTPALAGDGETNAEASDETPAPNPADEDSAESSDDAESQEGEGTEDEGTENEIGAELLMPAIEALLFVSDRPIRVQQICATLRSEFEQLRAPSVRAALQELGRRYQDPERSIGRGFELVEVDKGFMFRTHPDHSSFLRRFSEHKPQRLSRAALETLSVVAYRQPATRPQVEEIRGVDSSSAMKVLLERGLVRLLGKSEEVGRPLLYGTTPEFLELFGLKSLSHLPTLQEYQELDPEHQAKVEEKHGQPPVQVSDLVAEDQHIVSEQTEADGSGALEILEQAVELADTHRKATDESLEAAASTTEAAADPAPGSIEDPRADPSQDTDHGD